MQHLKNALLARERASGRLQSLEQLRAAGSMEAGRHGELRAQYQEALARAAKDLQQARGRLQARVLEVKGLIQETERRAADLDLRIRIGEFDADRLQARHEELARELAALRTEAELLAGAMVAESADALPVARTEAAAPPPPETPASWLPQAMLARLGALPGPTGLTDPAGAFLGLGAAAVLLLCGGVLPFWHLEQAAGYRLVVLAPALGWPLLSASVALGAAGFLPRPALRAWLQAGLVGLILLVWVLALFDAGTPAIATLVADVSPDPALAAAMKSILLQKSAACFLLPLGAAMALVSAGIQARAAQNDPAPALVS